MRCTITAVALRFDAFAPHPGEAGERTARKRRNDTGNATLPIAVGSQGRRRRGGSPTTDPHL